MAGRSLVLALLCLHFRAVMSSTLYQWIVDSQTRFNYDPDRNNALGVYNWPRSFPESCSGQHQSPVDIDTNRVRYGIQCPCPRMIYRSPMLAGEFKNNGHSASFEPESPTSFYIMDAPQSPGTYYLNDFHVHFGGVTGRSFELQGMRFRGSGIMSAGSEHTIDGLRFEGELHFVFFNGKYGNLQEAESKHDGIVVITLMVQKLPGTMVDNGETSEFSRFLEENVPKVQQYQQNASIEVDLRIFFNRRCDFYTYAGSITTPTCHESVRWVIMRDPIMVTERAWFLLTGLQSRGDFNSRFGNYRTTQPLNDRVIEANFLRTPGEGPVRPRPAEEAIMGPGMFLGMNEQPDVPMPVLGNRAPMLNNNQNPMPTMQFGRNNDENSDPNMQVPSGGNRSPMLNGNPNLMSPMPVGAPVPGGAPLPGMSSDAQMPGMSGGAPILPLPTGGAPMSSGAQIPAIPGEAPMPNIPGGAPVPGGSAMSGMPVGASMSGLSGGEPMSGMPGGAPMSGMPGRGQMRGMPSGVPKPGGMPMFGGAPMSGISPMVRVDLTMGGGAPMVDSPMPVIGNRSPMLNGNPNLTPVLPGIMATGGQLSMPVFDQNNLFNNNNNNNNNDDENNNNLNMNRNDNPMINGNAGMRQMLRNMPNKMRNAMRVMNAVQMAMAMQGQPVNMAMGPLMGKNTGPPQQTMPNQVNTMPPNAGLSDARMQPPVGANAMPALGDVGAPTGKGNMDKGQGGPKNGGNQAMVVMVPVKLVQWWNMNQEQMRRPDFFKIW